jgi:cell division protein FtsB
VKDWSVRLRLAMGATLVVLVLFAFVYPARAWLDQRSQVNGVRHDLSVLERQNELLQQEADRLQTPAEIERLARERFNMVRPGEHAYVVVPAGPPASVTTTTLPPTAETDAPPSTAAPTTVPTTSRAASSPTTQATVPRTTVPRPTTTTSTAPRTTTTTTVPRTTPTTALRTSTTTG